jgi:hypothetical protein
MFATIPVWMIHEVMLRQLKGVRHGGLDAFLNSEDPHPCYHMLNQGATTHSLVFKQLEFVNEHTINRLFVPMEVETRKCMLDRSIHVEQHVEMTGRVPVPKLSRMRIWKQIRYPHPRQKPHIKTRA